MIVVLADTHSTQPPKLTETLHASIATGDCLIHAGDFTTPAVVDAMEDLTESFVAVAGNADNDAVSRRLPETTQVTHSGVRIAVTHRVEGGTVARRLFGRAHDASVVVTGHTHRPTVAQADGLRLLNPGSHRRPRGGPPTFLTVLIFSSIW